MIRKFSPIVSKWHRNFGQSEIILSMDNGHSKNMEEENSKKRSRRILLKTLNSFPFVVMLRVPGSNLHFI